MSTLTLYDRVKESTTTSGTGTVSLLGAATGYTNFNSTVGNGNQTYYVIVDEITGDWEVGIGTYTTSGSTLSRTTVLSSSNSGSLVSFTSNAKDVFLSCPGSILSGIGAGSGTVTSIATGTGLTGGPITTTGTISVAAGGIGTTQIAAAAVSYAKIQNVGASSLLGNPTSGALTVEEITLGTGLSFSGTTLVASDPASIFTGTAGVTVSNTSTETTLLGSGVGSLAIPSGLTVAGKCLRFRARGYWSTLAATAGTLTINFKAGASTIATTGAISVPLSQANNVWEVDVDLNIYAYSGSGSFWTQGWFRTSVASQAMQQWDMLRTAANGIHTLPATLNCTATWSVASSSNTITTTNVELSGVN
jgi:hypothetical protein